MEIAALKASLAVDLSLGLVEMRVHECDTEWFVGMFYGSLSGDYNCVTTGGNVLLMYTSGDYHCVTTGGNVPLVHTVPSYLIFMDM